MKNDAVINMRVRSKEKVLLEQAAEVEGKSLSAFLRDCAEAAAIRALKEEG